MLLLCSEQGYTQVQQCPNAKKQGAGMAVPLQGWDDTYATHTLPQSVHESSYTLLLIPFPSVSPVRTYTLAIKL